MTTLPPFPETADIETSSADYAHRFAGAIGAWFLRVQEAATLRMLEPHPGATVLDVGGGHGQVTAALLQRGHQLTVLGSDEICQQRIRHLVDGQRCSFRVGNILDLPFPDQAFDVVISYRLLPHVTQWRQYLAEMTRVARTAVVVDFPSTRSVNSVAPYLFRFKKSIEKNTRTFTCFDESELLAVFRSLGFLPADRYPQFFLPMVLYRALKSPHLAAAIETPFRLFGLTNSFGSPVILKVAREGE